MGRRLCGAVRSCIWGHFVLGLVLFGLYILSLITAQIIYAMTMWPDVPTLIMGFTHDVLGTGGRRLMIALGMAIGFIFAADVLVVTLVSIPLLLDRNVGVPVAVATSLHVARRNPGPVAAWGLIVVALLVLGSTPVFLGLIVVMLILGHAS